MLGNYWVMSMRLGGSTVGPKLFYLGSVRWIDDVTSIIRITRITLLGCLSRQDVSDNENVMKQ